MLGLDRSGYDAGGTATSGGTEERTCDDDVLCIHWDFISLAPCFSILLPLASNFD